MTTRTHVMMTTEEESPGVPSWGPNAVTSIIPEGQDEISIENLVAGRRYYVKIWNEDEFGNQSTPIIRVVDTPAPTKIVPLAVSAQGVLDDGSPMYAYVKVPDEVKSVDSVKVSLAFRQFFASAKDAASSGTLTSNSGGGSTTASGGGSTSGSSSASTTNGSGHQHQWGTWISNTPGSYTKRKYNAQSSASMNLETDAANDLFSSADSPAHTHGMSHTHSTPNHSHTTPDHTHTTPGHTHDLTYGTFEETYPASHSVYMDVYKLSAGVWTYVDHVTGMTGDLETHDITSMITGPGDYQFRVQSDSGQPNSGRLGCDLYGTLTLTV